MNNSRLAHKSPSANNVKLTEKFIDAALSGHIVIVRKLLQHPIVVKDIAANNNYALRWSACNGHIEVVRELLRYDAVVKNVAACGNEALKHAATNGHVEIVRELLQCYRHTEIAELLTNCYVNYKR